ncbi:MAG: fibronectin type III domain-containing protein [Bacteroidales bacterium]|nr:fibronectin type III domain-containing protein [Bacteroidales bacterium]
MMITFSSPYEYNGGNLCFNIWCVTSAPSVYYKGVDPGYASCGYDYYITPPVNKPYSTESFLPKAEFTYESAGGCRKPKSFTANNVTDNSATLTWTAGGDETNWEVYLTQTDTNDPGDNPSSSYSVTECTKTFEGLSSQTTYYAFVRSVCGGEAGSSRWAKTTFTTLQTPVVLGASNAAYDDDFEDNCAWVFVNGDRPNQWCLGEAANNGGSKALYISNDNGVSNSYTASYQSKSMVYATKAFTFDGIYTFSFDWKCKGFYNDYFRVALVPASVELTAGNAVPHYTYSDNSLPQGWIALDGGSKLNQGVDGPWSNHTAYELQLEGSYMMVFAWLNTSTYGGYNPPAAIDNVSIRYISCPRPTNLAASNVEARTAVLTWTENGTATNWILQYATDANFSTNLVEINEGFTVNENYAGCGLTGLSGETKYYVRVKSNCESSWSDVINFTTNPTCAKPTNVTANLITAYSASIGWTNGEEGQEAWEISYSTTTQSDPENGTVVDADTNPYTLTGLTPETSYYVYVRANCGDEDGMSAWSIYKYFSTLATCVKPTNLTASNVTSSTATITWTAGETDQTAWNLQYKKSSDSEWTTIPTDATTCNLENLSPVTTYDVRVQADCGDGDLSQWATNSFTTACGALGLPYTYGFEDNLVTTSPYSSSNPFPKCWDRVAYQSGYPGSYTYYPYVFTATISQPYAHGGNGANTYSGHSMRFYQTYSSTNECAVLPEISNEYEMNHLQIRFWAAVQSSQGTLKIGIMESQNNASTFTSIQEVTISNTYSSGFQEFTVPFSSYTGNGRYIAFMCGTGSSYAYFLIDDITVEEIPTCLIPTNLEATVNSETETTLTWQPGDAETDWEIEVTAEDSGIMQTIVVNGAPTYTLTTTQATTYSARIRANCGDGDYSEWSDYISFTYDCGVMTIDATHSFAEDFENVEATAFPPTCWEKFHYQMSGNTNSYWYLNSNNGLGSSTAYSYWNEGYAFLVMPKMHIDGEATLSFDYLIGSGDYDESCSVVVSTGEMTFNDFNQIIWLAEGSNSGNASATVSLKDFDGQDIYIAFKYKGSGTSGCIWYVDNVQVYVGEIFTKDITAYTEGSKDRYYLIASPIGEVSPENVTDMLSNSYDLYRFNQNPTLVDGIGLEWENYKAESFNLEPGKGYLYANSQNVTLTFTGVPYSGNDKVTLTKTNDVDWSGWNLVGNPFAQTAYITKTFYTMNDNGSEVIAGTGNSIEAMEGVFVIANQDGEEMSFGTTQPTKQNQQFVVNVTHNRGTAIDRAIICFDEGQQMPKFQLNPNNTKIYVAQGNKDYAIVRSAAQGEMPVSFKAAENGTYTLSVEAENVEMNYLHLVDNMTGADVDLLATPSYSFEARTSDYTSRFRLVFSASQVTEPVEGPSAFAFFNGSEWVVSNMGEATLQVIDMMGRVLSSQAISGNADLNVNQPAGVYMLRLINGADVKVQKVVVR